MTTITIKVNEKSRKGKALLEFMKAFFSEEGDVQLILIEGVPINKDSESTLNLVSENSAKYKTPRKVKKETKKSLDSDSEESPYNPEFVEMVLAAEKRGNYTTLDPNDIWGSLGLK